MKMLTASNMVAKGLLILLYGLNLVIVISLSPAHATADTVICMHIHTKHTVDFKVMIMTTLFTQVHVQS